MGLLDIYLSIKKNNIKKQSLNQITIIRDIIKLEPSHPINCYLTELEEIITSNAYDKLNRKTFNNKDRLDDIFAGLWRVTYDGGFGSKCEIITKHFDLLEEKLNLLRRL